MQPCLNTITWFLYEDIITTDDVGEDNIARYLRKGYIRRIGTNRPAEAMTELASDESLPFYMTTEEYLELEQLDNLNRAQLLEYGNHIGVPELKANASIADLKTLINDFIEDDDDEQA